MQSCEQRQGAGDVARAAIDRLEAAVELHPLGRVGRRADLERLLEQAAGLGVVARARPRSAPSPSQASLTRSLSPFTSASRSTPAQQLLGLVEPAHAPEHHGVQELERARPLLRRGLAGQLLGAHAQAAGDLHQDARAGAAVAGLDAGQIAVRAAVEREVALGHPPLAAQVPDAGAELAQRLVRVLAAPDLPRRPCLDLPSPAISPFLAILLHRPGAASADYTSSMAFPTTRLRRLRRTAGIRRMVRETRLSPADLIQPLFVRHGGGRSTPIAVDAGPAPPVDRRPGRGGRGRARGRASRPCCCSASRRARTRPGARPTTTRASCSSASARSRRRCPTLLVITDVCLCQYTSHGHCGVLRDGEVDNDVTPRAAGRTAVSHAAAGADIVAPSDMMDGRVGGDPRGARRRGPRPTPRSWPTAPSSPRRSTARSATPRTRRRPRATASGYQMDPANGREAVREALLDIDEGADMVMVKPALPYLDVMRRLRTETLVPLAAYQVSGEYAMLEAAAARGLVDRAGRRARGADARSAAPAPTS